MANTISESNTLFGDMLMYDDRINKLAQILAILSVYRRSEAQEARKKIYSLFGREDKEETKSIRFTIMTICKIAIGLKKVTTQQKRRECSAGNFCSYAIISEFFKFCLDKLNSRRNSSELSLEVPYLSIPTRTIASSVGGEQVSETFVNKDSISINRSTITPDMFRCPFNHATRTKSIYHDKLRMLEEEILGHGDDGIDNQKKIQEVRDQINREENILAVGIPKLWQAYKFAVLELDFEGYMLSNPEPSDKTSLGTPPPGATKDQMENAAREEYRKRLVNATGTNISDTEDVLDARVLVLWIQIFDNIMEDKFFYKPIYLFYEGETKKDENGRLVNVPVDERVLLISYAKKYDDYEHKFGGIGYWKRRKYVSDSRIATQSFTKNLTTLEGNVIYNQALAIPRSAEELRVENNYSVLAERHAGALKGFMDFLSTTLEKSDDN